MRWVRSLLGLVLVYAGLRVLPPGVDRDGLRKIVRSWARHVRGA